MLWMRATFTYIVCVCFPTTMAEMSSANRVVWPAKPQVFTLWFFVEKKVYQLLQYNVFKKIISYTWIYTIILVSDVKHSDSILLYILK